jgi:hypothetical protein
VHGARGTGHRDALELPGGSVIGTGLAERAVRERRLNNLVWNPCARILGPNFAPDKHSLGLRR